MAEGRRKSFLCAPVEICDPGVGAIVGAKPGYQPLYRNVYIFTAAPGPQPVAVPAQADPQLVSPDPCDPGPVVRAGEG